MYKNDKYINKKFSLKIKVTSKIILIAFVSLALKDLTWAITQTSSILALYIPGQLGKITETYTGGTQGKIICIQDLHCHAQVQNNIFGIIKIIKNTYKKNCKMIGIEGAFSDIDTGILADIPDKEIKENVTRYFLKKGDISGAELYDIMLPNRVKLQGIEDKKDYFTNFSSLYKSFVYITSIQTIIDNIRKNFHLSKKYLYPDVLKEFEQKETMYNQNKISMQTYLLYLKQKVDHYKVQFKREYPQVDKLIKSFELKQTINLNTVNTEAGYVIKRLSQLLTQKEVESLQQKTQAGTDDEYYLYLKKILEKKRIELGNTYKNLSNYMKYLELLNTLDNIQILEEIRDLKYKLQDKMIQGRTHGKNLVYCDRYLGLFNEYLANRVSSKDVQRWLSNKHMFIKKLPLMTKSLCETDYFDENKELFFESEKNMANFYQIANKRNEILAKNITKKMKSKNEVRVMIIGGYHTEGVKALLKSKGMSYDIITPGITEPVNENIYKKRVLDQAKWLSEQKTETLLSYKPGSLEKNALMVLPRLITGDTTEEIVAQTIQEALNMLSKTQSGDKLQIMFMNFLEKYTSKQKSKFQIQNITFKNGSIEYNIVQPKNIEKTTTKTAYIKTQKAPSKKRRKKRKKRGGKKKVDVLTNNDNNCFFVSSLRFLSEIQGIANDIENAYNNIKELLAKQKKAKQERKDTDINRRKRLYNLLNFLKANTPQEKEKYFNKLRKQININNNFPLGIQHDASEVLVQIFSDIDAASNIDKKRDQYQGYGFVDIKYSKEKKEGYKEPNPTFIKSSMPRLDITGNSLQSCFANFFNTTQEELFEYTNQNNETINHLHAKQFTHLYTKDLSTLPDQMPITLNRIKYLETGTYTDAQKDFSSIGHTSPVTVIFELENGNLVAQKFDIKTILAHESAAFNKRIDYGHYNMYSREPQKNTFTKKNGVYETPGIKLNKISKQNGFIYLLEKNNTKPVQYNPNIIHDLSSDDSYLQTLNQAAKKKAAFLENKLKIGNNLNAGNKIRIKPAVYSFDTIFSRNITQRVNENDYSNEMRESLKLVLQKKYTGTKIDYTEDNILLIEPPIDITIKYLEEKSKFTINKKQTEKELTKMESQNNFINIINNASTKAPDILDAIAKLYEDDADSRLQSVIETLYNNPAMELIDTYINSWITSREKEKGIIEYQSRFELSRGLKCLMNSIYEDSAQNEELNKIYLHLAKLRNIYQPQNQQFKNTIEAETSVDFFNSLLELRVFGAIEEIFNANYLKNTGSYNLWIGKDQKTNKTFFERAETIERLKTELSNFIKKAKLLKNREAFKAWLKSAKNATDILYRRNITIKLKNLQKETQYLLDNKKAESEENPTPRKELKELNDLFNESLSIIEPLSNIYNDLFSEENPDKFFANLLTHIQEKNFPDIFKELLQVLGHSKITEKFIMQTDQTRQFVSYYDKKIKNKNVGQKEKFIDNIYATRDIVQKLLRANHPLFISITNSLIEITEANKKNTISELMQENQESFNIDKFFNDLLTIQFHTNETKTKQDYELTDLITNNFLLNNRFGKLTALAEKDDLYRAQILKQITKENKNNFIENLRILESVINSIEYDVRIENKEIQNLQVFLTSLRLDINDLFKEKATKKKKIQKQSRTEEKETAVEETVIIKSITQKDGKTIIGFYTEQEIKQIETSFIKLISLMDEMKKDLSDEKLRINRNKNLLYRNEREQGEQKSNNITKLTRDIDNLSNEIRTGIENQSIIKNQIELQGRHTDIKKKFKELTKRPNRIKLFFINFFLFLKLTFRKIDLNISKKTGVSIFGFGSRQQLENQLEKHELDIHFLNQLLDDSEELSFMLPSINETTFETLKKKYNLDVNLLLKGLVTQNILQKENRNGNIINALNKDTIGKITTFNQLNINAFIRPFNTDEFPKSLTDGKTEKQVIDVIKKDIFKLLFQSTAVYRYSLLNNHSMFYIMLYKITIDSLRQDITAEPQKIINYGQNENISETKNDLQKFITEQYDFMKTKNKYDVYALVRKKIEIFKETFFQKHTKETILNVIDKGTIGFIFLNEFFSPLIENITYTFSENDTNSNFKKITRLQKLTTFDPTKEFPKLIINTPEMKTKQSNLKKTQNKLKKAKLFQNIKITLLVILPIILPVIGLFLDVVIILLPSILKLLNKLIQWISKKDNLDLLDKSTAKTIQPMGLSINSKNLVNTLNFQNFNNLFMQTTPAIFTKIAYLDQTYNASLTTGNIRTQAEASALIHELATLLTSDETNVIPLVDTLFLYYKDLPGGFEHLDFLITYLEKENAQHIINLIHYEINESKLDYIPGSYKNERHEKLSKLMKETDRTTLYRVYEKTTKKTYICSALELKKTYGEIYNYTIKKFDEKSYIKDIASILYFESDQFRWGKGINIKTWNKLSIELEKMKDMKLNYIKTDDGDMLISNNDSTHILRINKNGTFDKFIMDELTREITRSIFFLFLLSPLIGIIAAGIYGIYLRYNPIEKNYKLKEKTSKSGFQGIIDIIQQIGPGISSFGPSLLSAETYFLGYDGLINEINSKYTKDYIQKNRIINAESAAEWLKQKTSPILYPDIADTHKKMQTSVTNLLDPITKELIKIQYTTETEIPTIMKQRQNIYNTHKFYRLLNIPKNIFEKNDNIDSTLFSKLCNQLITGHEFKEDLELRELIKQNKDEIESLKDEAKLTRMEKLMQEAHDYASKPDVGGVLQAHFYSMTDELLALDNLEQITPQTLKQVWQDIKKVRDTLREMGGANTIMMGDVIRAFPNVREAIVRDILMSADIGYGGEVLINVENISGLELEKALDEMGLLFIDPDTKIKRLVPNINIVLVKDFSKYEATDLKNIKDTIIRFNDPAKQGSPTSKIVMNLGEIALRKSLESENQDLRDLIDLDYAAPMYLRKNRNLKTSSGYLNINKIERILEEKEQSPDVRTKQKPNEQFISEYVNVSFKTRAKIISILEKVEKGLGQSTANQLDEYLDKNRILKNDEMVKGLENILQANQTAVEQELGVSLNRAARAWEKSWDMIYNNITGLLESTDKLGHEDVSKKYPNIIQSTEGFETLMPAIENQKQYVNKVQKIREQIKAPKKIYIENMNSRGSAYINEVHGDSKKVLDVIPVKEPDIDIVSFEAATEMSLPELLEITVTSIIGLGVKFTGFKKLMELTTKKNVKKREDQQALQALTAAA